MSIFPRSALARWGLISLLSGAAGPGIPLAVTPSVAWADPVSSTRPEEPPSGDSPLPETLGGMGAALVRTALVLALVVALIYLTLNLGLRRLMGVRAIPVGRKPVVTILERVPLSQRHSLFVVQVAGDFLLLGSGDSGVSLLSRLNAESMNPEQPKSDGSSSPFLAKLLSRRDPS